MLVFRGCNLIQFESFFILEISTWWYILHYIDIYFYYYVHIHISLVSAVVLTLCFLLPDPNDSSYPFGAKPLGDEAAQGSWKNYKVHAFSPQKTYQKVGILHVGRFMHEWLYHFYIYIYIHILKLYMYIFWLYVKHTRTE